MTDLRDIALPQVKATSLGVKLAIAAVIALVVGYMAWATFVAPGRVRAVSAETTAHATGGLRDAEGQTGAAAVNTVAGNAAKETIIRETTRNNYYEITKQPGAGDPVSDPVWDAFLRSVCLRESAASLSDCQRLREVAAGEVEAAGP